jgi:hypothetical protein
MEINNGSNAQVDNSLSAAGVRRMKRQARTSIPERLGRWTGRVWRGYVRREARVLLWLQGKGVPMLLAKGLLWGVKLALIGTLLYVLFWVTLILILAIAAARGVLNTEPDPDEDRVEWRDGLCGYGMYDSKGYRIDPHDPDEQL